MDTSTKSESENNVNYDYNFGNYNPDDVDVEETINAVFAIDVSSSVTDYVAELNEGMNEFVEEIQGSHVSDKVFVSIVEFASQVKTTSGFRPIKNMDPIDFSKNIGGMTALYEGTKVALQNALDYREGLEDAGVNCKTLLFVITDGDDNNSNCQPSDVKDIINDLLKEERNFASFEAILFGINKSNESYYENAASEMGIKNVATIDNTAKDIRKMINFISSSVSSASAGGNAISTPNF